MGFSKIRKVKICIVSASHSRYDIRLFQKQAQSLYKCGFDVSLLIMDNGIDEVVNSINIFTAEKYWSNRIKVLLFGKKLFLDKAINIDADIYQLQSPECLSLGIELKRLGKKVIYDSEEDLPNLVLIKPWIPKFLRSIVSFILKKYMSYILKHYDLIISPHSHVVEFMKQINNQSHLVTNFPLIQTDIFFSRESYLEREQNICYTGTVYPYSNQIFILDALNNINKINYNIAGTMSPEVTALLASHPNFSLLKYYGFLSMKELKLFYLKNRIGIVILDYCKYLGSKKGTLAVNKIFEYMEAGLPIVCTDYDLWKEIVEKYDCGICVQPHNVTEINKAIVFLLTNPERAYQMGQNGRKVVVEKFNWGSQEKIYIDLIQKLN